MQLLQKNGQISSINGITEEQVELSLKPEELNGQQAEGAVTDGKDMFAVSSRFLKSMEKANMKLEFGIFYCNVQTFN